MGRLLLVALSLVATTSFAASPGAPEARMVAAPNMIECHCRANGQDYELGARICLRSPAGYRLAECRMQQNVTSWTFGQEDCSPTASRPAAPGAMTAALALTRS